MLKKDIWKLVFIALVFLGVAHLEWREDQDNIRAEAKTKTKAKTKITESPLTQEEVKIAQFFIAHKSPDPARMARAVARRKRPALAAKQAVVESHANPKARGKKGEKGAWQVIEKDWGKVPKTPEGQAIQNEKILDELLQKNKGDLRKALTAYNGTGPDARRYASLVLGKSIEVR